MSKRLVYICDWLPPDFGAVGQYAVLFARQWASEGWSVTLVGLTRGLSSREKAVTIGDGSLEVLRVHRRAYQKQKFMARLVWTVVSNVLLLGAAFKAMWQADSVLFTGSPPLMIHFLAPLNVLLRKKLIYRITDFHPECLIAERGYDGPVLRLLLLLTRFWRHRVDSFEVLGLDQARRLAENGIPEARVRLKRDPSPVRFQPGLRPLSLPNELRGGTGVILYSGNWGVAHDEDTFIEAYSQYVQQSHHCLRFWLNATGAKADRVERELRQRGAPIYRSRLVPLEELPQLLVAVDVHLITLRDPFIGYVVPSKIYSCIESDKRILFVGSPSSDVHLVATNALLPDRYCRVDVGDVDALVKALHAMERAIVMEAAAASVGSAKTELVFFTINSPAAMAEAERENCQLLYVGPDARAPKRTRIAVLNSHPIQYFAPLYAYLNSAPDLEVTALYLSDISIRGGKDVEFGREVKWDLDLLAGYQCVFLGEKAHAREPGGFWSLIAPEAWKEVRCGQYDVLWLHGHNYAANLIALLAAKSKGLPIMMRGETHHGLACGRIKAIIRRPLMGGLYSWCDRLLAIGSQNAAFYRAMGVPEEKIFLVPYSVDNDRFIRSTQLTDEQRIEVRKRYKIAVDQPAVLFAAKFTRRKRPGDILKAARQLKYNNTRPFTVVMAGSGELEPELRTFCLDHGLDNVVFTGFVNQSELPVLYGASDLFVLPSEHEPWGLAINEAMCASLPVVVSQEVGCVPDLVRDGVNGYTPAAGNILGLSQALRRLIEDEALRRRQGQASLARIQEWGYQACLQGIRAALVSLNDPRFPRTPMLQLN